MFFKLAWKASDCASDCSRVVMVLKILMSAPATNVSPAPTSTTRPDRRGRQSLVRPRPRSLRARPEPSAFTGGLSIVMTATPSPTSYRIISSPTGKFTGTFLVREIPAMEFDELVRRVRGEFLEMPGLVLTFPQAERLWGSSRISAARSSTRSSGRNFSAARPPARLRAPTPEISRGILMRGFAPRGTSAGPCSPESPSRARARGRRLPGNSFRERARPTSRSGLRRSCRCPCPPWRLREAPPSPASYCRRPAPTASLSASVYRRCSRSMRARLSRARFAGCVLRIASSVRRASQYSSQPVLRPSVPSCSQT